LLPTRLKAVIRTTLWVEPTALLAAVLRTVRLLLVILLWSAALCQVLLHTLAYEATAATLTGVVSLKWVDLCSLLSATSRCSFEYRLNALLTAALLTAALLTAALLTAATRWWET